MNEHPEAGKPMLGFAPSPAMIDFLIRHLPDADPWRCLK
jgi:hypothetical protein